MSKTIPLLTPEAITHREEEARQARVHECEQSILAALNKFECDLVYETLSINGVIAEGRFVCKPRTTVN